MGPGVVGVTVADVPRLFGPVPGVAERAEFASRIEASRAGVHRPTVAGISGTPVEGADSIVVSGGYEDDEDYGNVIVYTGHGGKDEGSKKQVADQEFAAGNAALALSGDQGLPIRVIRGSGGDPEHSPSDGYRYDGIYHVASWWEDTGQSGFRIYRYRVVKDAAPNADNPPVEPSSDEESENRYSTVQRLVRNTAVTQGVKQLHDFTCQVCARRLVTPTGGYAEGAHIRPRGRPHNGPDIPSNVLCLCANDHVLFDRGALFVTDEFEVIEAARGGIVGGLRLEPRHSIDRNFLAYHRRHFGFEDRPE